MRRLVDTEEEPVTTGKTEAAAAREMEVEAVGTVGTGAVEAMETGEVGQAESEGQVSGGPCIPATSQAPAFELTTGTFETTAEGQPTVTAQQQAALIQLALLTGPSQAIRVIEQHVNAWEQITMAQARDRVVVEVPDAEQIHEAAQTLLEQEEREATTAAEEPESAAEFAEDEILLESGGEEL